MSKPATAKLFKHGRSQAVRLPKEFRLPGTEVRVRRVGNGVLLEPIPTTTDWDTFFDAIDKLGPFDIERNQPPPPKPEDLFD
jgi:antitoxin VapB